MNFSITSNMIRHIILAVLIVVLLCFPGRANLIVNQEGGPMGACCFSDGSCLVLSLDSCKESAGTYSGDDTLCEDVMCPQPGVCCIPNESCVMSLVEDCFLKLGGKLWVPGQDCEKFVCPPFGACCLLEGKCEVMTESNCTILFEGIYQGDGVLCQDSCAKTCAADLDSDGSVGTSDLLVLFSLWGTNPDGPPDFNGDGTVDTSDLLELFANWGPCK